MTPLRLQNMLPESKYRIPELYSGIRQDSRWVFIEILRATCPKIMISTVKIMIFGPENHQGCTPNFFQKRISTHVWHHYGLRICCLSPTIGFLSSIVASDKIYDRFSWNFACNMSQNHDFNWLGEVILRAKITVGAHLIFFKNVFLPMYDTTTASEYVAWVQLSDSWAL